MIKIRYITPFSLDKNIGREYNQVISELPDDCYICLRDGDTMFLTDDWGKQIEQIILSNTEYDVITCMTNRIGNEAQRSHGMFNIDSITNHIERANWHKEAYGNYVVDHNIAPGLFMIFHKSVWDKIKFVENSIFFDKRFSEEVLKQGLKIGLAKGFYLLHLYRWGKDNPQSYTNHLRECIVTK